MDIADERLPDPELGVQIASGRDTRIFAFGEGKVVRRAADDRSYVLEAEVMRHVGASGFPVPRVHRIGPGEMVIDRVPGPTMVADLGRRPWRMVRHAHTLAELHRRLHDLSAPEGWPSGPVPGDAVVHLDLHPANVILSPTGPVVIDWTNAARGAGEADVALTWIILASAEVDGSIPLRAATTLFRRHFVDAFLSAAGRNAPRRVLRSVAEHRLADRNIHPTEITAIQRLLADETS